MRDDYDLIIVGGGLVGASLCLALAHLPLRIALIEAKSFNSSNQNPRSIALSYGSSRIFTGLEVWQDLLPFSTSILSIHVSDQGHFGTSLIQASDTKVPALGYIIAHSHINQILLNHLSQKNIKLFAPAEITAINKNEHDDWQLQLSYNEQPLLLKTKLLIAADGNNSFIRQQQNIPVTEQCYPQSAILTKVTLKHPHQHIAYERFTKDGAIALLPLDENKASVVWTLPHSAAQEIINGSDELFIEKLQKAFGFRLGNFLTVSAKYLLPLKMTVAQQQIKPGLLLLGNAAQSLHPIAAQGFNLALKHVAILAELINSHYHDNKEINYYLLLKEYEQQTKRDRQQIIKFTHYLTKIFSNNIFPLNAFRNSGLVLLDILPVPKKLFAKKCMGIHGRLPLLLRV
jgi:2-octaprenyl-6-methoxyphenol hydroxylase